MHGYFGTFTPVAFRITDSRLLMALRVRFSFRAIEGLSIFEFQERQKLRILCGRPWSAVGARA